MGSMRKVGIYAGTFDPIHNGHLAFAKEAITRHKLEKVFLLVEPRPRRKQGVKAFEHRVKMVQLAIADEPKLATISLEHSRFNVVDTLPILQARFAGCKLFFLIGDDVLSHLSDWPHVENLISSVEFIIGARKGSVKEVEQIVRTIEETRGLKVHYTTFVNSMSMQASSLVRSELRKGKRPVGLNDQVWEYIQAQKLYAPA